jgi:hypothetical protein
MGAPQRRTVYIASLEAHVDQLHSRMYDIGVFPIDITSLDRFKGLNSKTAKARCTKPLFFHSDPKD